MSRFVTLCRPWRAGVLVVVGTLLFATLLAGFRPLYAAGADASAAEVPGEAASADAGAAIEGDGDGEADNTPAGPAASQTAGWVTTGGKTYYYLSDGTKATGLTAIEGDTYWFSAAGVMARDALKTVKGARYYFKANGKAAVGSCKVKGNYYVFDAGGKLARGAATHIVVVNGRAYRAKKGGRAASGWVSSGSKLYYFTKRGISKANVTYQGITFKASGVAKNNVHAKLKRTCMSLVAKLTTGKMSKRQKLRAVYNYVMFKLRWTPSAYPSKELLAKRTWWRTHAYNTLTSKRTNCYGYASCFAALAFELGYSPTICRMAKDHCYVLIAGKAYDNMSSRFGTAPQAGQLTSKVRVKAW